MFCNRCGAQNPDQASFCARCGAPLPHPAPAPNAPTIMQRAPVQQKTRHGSWVVPLVIGVILIIAAAAVSVPLIHYLQAKNSYTLNAQTVTYLKSYTQKTTVTVCADRSTFLGSTNYAPVVKMIEAYPKASSHITVNYVNLVKSPALKAKYAALSPSDGDIVVECGSRLRLIPNSNLVLTKTDSNGNTSVTGYDVEQRLDMALLYVSGESTPTVTLITGHNESFAALKDTLKNDIQFREYALSSGDIDAGSSAAIIINPQKDFTAAEISKLDVYLKSGGNLMVLFDPTEPALPNLESFVKGWGIQVNKGAVYDVQNSLGGNCFAGICGNTDPTLSKLLPGDKSLIYYMARPLTLTAGYGENSVTPLISSKDTARLWAPAAVTSGSVSSFKPSDSDQKGPFVLIAKSTRTVSQNGKALHPTVWVSGSAGMLNTTQLLSDTLANADLLQDSVDSLLGSAMPFNIPPAPVSSK